MLCIKLLEIACLCGYLLISARVHKTQKWPDSCLLVVTFDFALDRLKPFPDNSHASIIWMDSDVYESYPPR
jgi:hypothetical protein